MKYIKTFEELDHNDRRNDRIYIDSSTSCAVYNSDVPELAAIFYSKEMAKKYVYGLTDTSTRLASAIKNKSVIPANKTVLGFRVAVRNASSAQIEMLGDKKYLILKDYPKPGFGFGNKTIPEPKLNSVDPNGRKAAYSKNRRENKIDRELLDEMNPIKTLDVK